MFCVCQENHDRVPLVLPSALGRIGEYVSQGRLRFDKAEATRLVPRRNFQE